MVVHENDVNGGENYHASRFSDHKKTHNRECDGSGMICYCYHFRSTAALFQFSLSPRHREAFPTQNRSFFTHCVLSTTVLRHPCLYQNSNDTPKKKHNLLRWRQSENSVGEVEKTRLRLPGTSVMSLSSPAHLRLLIAALAILMLP